MSKLSIEDLAQRSINILDQLFPKASELFPVVSIPQQVRQLKKHYACIKLDSLQIVAQRPLIG